MNNSKQLLAGMATLSWFATGNGLVSAIMMNSNEPIIWGVSQYIEAAIIFTLAGLVQLLMMTFLAFSLRSRATSPLRWPAAMLFTIALAFSVTFALATYGEKFGVLTSHRQAHLESYARPSAKQVEGIDSHIKTVNAKIAGMAASMDSAKKYEGRTGEGPRYDAYDAIHAEMVPIVEAISEVDGSELIARIKNAKSISDLKNAISEAETFGDMEFALIETFVSSAPSKLPDSNNQSAYVQRFVADLDTLTQILDEKIEFVSKDVANQLTPFAWAKDVWSDVFIQPEDVDKNTWIAIFLALMVDIFITALIILGYRKNPVMVTTVEEAREENSKGFIEFSKLVSNAGYETPSSAMKDLRKNSNIVGGARFVLNEAPQTSSKMSELLSALEASGHVKEMPFAPNFAEMVKRPFFEISDPTRVQAYVISKTKWAELLSYQLIEMTTTRLKSTMTFGEFVSAVQEIPSQRAFMNSNVQGMIDRVALHFPEMLSTKMIELTVDARKEFEKEFTSKMSRRLSHRTRVAYVAYLHRFLALAEAQKLLPHEVEVANSNKALSKAA